MQKSFVKEFKLYCKKKNLDVNSHQIKLIKTLDEYYKLTKSHQIMLLIH